MRIGTALLASALLAGTAAPAAFAEEVDGAVFTMTNTAVGANEVVAFERRANGSLRPIGRFPTGGRGSGPAPTSSVFGAPIAATADGLGSQDSLILSDDNRLLFAVNGGSDSVACFRVNADGPGPLLSAARTAASGGVFPVSLTFRGDGRRGGLLFVLNSGEEGNITGFRVGADCSLRRVGGGQSGPLSGLVEDPPFPDPEPNEVLTTPGQVGFTPDGRRLVVTFKGGPVEGAEGLPTGDMAVFRVDPATGRLVGDPTVTAFAGRAGQAGPFSFTFDADGRVVVNLANSFSVASYEIARSGELELAGGPVPISGLGDGSLLAFGGFNCWIVRRGNTLYVMTFGDIPATNGGLPDGPGVISALRVGDDGSLRLLRTPAGRPRGVVAVLPQDDRGRFRPGRDGTFGNHGIDMAVVEDGGRAFLYAIEPRVGEIGAWEINRDGTLRFIRNFDGGIREGVDPFAGTNPGINDFTERCYLQDRRDLSPECRQGSAQGIAGF
jgi:hypothetical protein